MRDDKFENGRRFHTYREGRCPFLKEEDEQDRCGMEHAIFKSRGRKLHFAPSSPKKSLDAGARPGRWAIDGGFSMLNMI